MDKDSNIQNYSKKKPKQIFNNKKMHYQLFTFNLNVKYEKCIRFRQLQKKICEKSNKKK